MSSTLTKWLCISFLCPCLNTIAVAQIVQSARWEIPFSRHEVPFEILPLNQNGVILYRGVGTENQGDQLELSKLDTALQEKWHGFIPLTPQHLLVGKYTDDNNAYFLFRYRDYSRNNFELIAISQDSARYIRHQIRNFIAFTPSEFQVTSYGALIGGYFNRVPVVLFYSFETQRARILPGLLNESGELNHIKTYADGSFDVLISAKSHTGTKTVWIKNYDRQAELLRNYALTPEENKHLIFARAMKTEQNVQLVAGVFGTRNSEFSRGLFMASIEPISGMEQLRYYNYGDLENFFKYMKAKREKRIKERIQRRKIRGKKIKFNYRLLVHEIVQYKDQYILVGEAFYPRYVTPDRSSAYGFFRPGGYQSGSTFSRNGQVFDGYYYTHAVVMGFNSHGKLLWDNSFEINDVRTFTLEQFVKLEAQDDKIVLLYVYDNELRSKIIQDNSVLEGKTREPIKTKQKSDVIKKENDNVTKLAQWYDNYLYAYGVQELSNAQTGKRRVFYINKLRCE